jgi:hypothetical protein
MCYSAGSFLDAEPRQTRNSSYISAKNNSRPSNDTSIASNQSDKQLPNSNMELARKRTFPYDDDFIYSDSKMQFMFLRLKREELVIQQDRSKLEQDKAKLEQEKARLEQEKARLEQEKAKFEREKLKFEREKHQ